jgi:beta-lactamase superfamily II metal-dependent hydrolase
MFHFGKIIRKVGLVRLMTLLAFIVFIFAAVSWWGGIRGVMKITFLDIGQGDAVLVTAPGGVRMLYDAGQKDGSILSRLGEELPWYVDTIDICVASHPDDDHAGGFINVLSRYHCRIWLDGHINNHTGVFHELEDLIQKHAPKRASILRGSEIYLGDVYAHVLHPKGKESLAWRSIVTNAESIVLKISYGSSSLLLSGDLPIDQENELARGYGTNLESDIFKAGHHGSKTSSGASLLSHVKPSFVAVSYGSRNRYGHPSREAMDRLKSTGAEIHETAREGSIHFVCTRERCFLDN